MTRELDITFPEPSFDQAIVASQTLWMVYRLGDLDDEAAERDLDNQEAARRIAGIAVGIMKRTITSHLEIERGIKNLGFRIGPLGGIAWEIDQASFKLNFAIRERFDELTEVEELMKKNPLG